MTPSGNQTASTNRTALVTGITGQDGAYIPELLLAEGCKAVGTFRRTSLINFRRLQALDLLGGRPNPECVGHHLTDHGSTLRIAEGCPPDEIDNLGAQSFVGVSFDQPITAADEILARMYHTVP
jgi:GDPmannose 4,6-dehydratase